MLLNWPEEIPTDCSSLRAAYNLVNALFSSSPAMKHIQHIHWHCYIFPTHCSEYFPSTTMVWSTPPFNIWHTLHFITIHYSTFSISPLRTSRLGPVSNCAYITNDILCNCNLFPRCSPNCSKLLISSDSYFKSSSSGGISLLSYISYLKNHMALFELLSVTETRNTYCIFHSS